MAVEVSDVALEDTPRRRRKGQRWFTENTLDWFRLGEEIAENPVDGEYAEPPDKRRPLAMHVASITLGLCIGLLASWLVW